MGRPFEAVSSPRAEETERSSDGEGWVEEGDNSEWEDPSGGVLSRVFEAAENGDADELADLLAELEVSIDTRGVDSDTPLHLASLYGHTECVRLLLAKGARADVADADGALPLHDAAAGGYTAICEMLLDASPGCIDRGDSEGDTPLHNGARGGHEEVVALLVARGADSSLQNDEFKTAAQVAERGSRVRELLEEAARAATATSAAAQPEAAPPAAEVA